MYPGVDSIASSLLKPNLEIPHQITPLANSYDEVQLNTINSLPNSSDYKIPIKPNFISLVR